MLILGAAAAALLIGILLGYIIRKSVSEKTIGSAEQRAQNIVLDAENQAETIKKEITKLNVMPGSAETKSTGSRSVSWQRKNRSTESSRILKKKKTA